MGWIALALLTSVIFLLSWHTLTSVYQDIGRHLTIGQFIWESRMVPKTNLFSFTAPDFSFINHHWLAEVLLYLSERAVGLRGLIALKAFMLTGAFVLALAAAFKRAVLMPALGIGLLSIFILAERTDVRPEILSFLFLGWFLFVLYRKPDSRLLWTLPLVQLLWVNTHIYFFMGPFLFIAWTAGLIVRDGWVTLRHRRIWLLGVLLAAATVVNPWGIHGALYPFSIFDNYGYSIVENKSYFFLKAFGYPAFTFSAFVVGLVLAVVSFLLNRKRVKENVMGIILIGATAILAFIMVRNLPLFGLVMMPVILQNLSQAGIQWSKRGLMLSIVVLGLLALSIVQSQLYGRISPGSKQFGLHVPSGHQAAVDFFKETGLKGPIFNNFDIGSYLIWKLPEEKVFIDGRPEAYPAEFIQETYIRAQERQEAWTELVEVYGLSTIFWNTRDITPWSRAFLSRIYDDPLWVQVYGDDSIAIWIHNTEDNRLMLERLGASEP